VLSPTTINKALNMTRQSLQTISCLFSNLHVVNCHSWVRAITRLTFPSVLVVTRTSPTSLPLCTHCTCQTGSMCLPLYPDES